VGDSAPGGASGAHPLPRVGRDDERNPGDAIAMNRDRLKAPSREGGATRVFTVDLEEYFEVQALREFIPPAEWDALPPRVDRAVDSLLSLLDRHSSRATFFASAWVAERHPALVRRIVDEGHEVGVLGRNPDRDDRAERVEEWRRDVRETRERLERVAGMPVIGYRSSRFTHPVGPEDAVTFLADAGFQYDSTLTGRRIREDFGRRSSPTGTAPTITTPEGRLLEVPPTTLQLFGRRIFTVGRTAFRVLPLAMIRRTLEDDASDGLAGMFCMRSWEMDSAQPTLPVSLMSRVRLYWGLDRVEDRLEALLRDYRFVSVAEALGLASFDPPEEGEDSASRDDRDRASVRQAHG